MKSLRILALAHPDLIPPDNPDAFSEAESYVWKTEYDVSLDASRAAATK